MDMPIIAITVIANKIAHYIPFLHAANTNTTVPLPILPAANTVPLAIFQAVTTILVLIIVILLAIITTLIIYIWHKNKKNHPGIIFHSEYRNQS